MSGSCTDRGWIFAFSFRRLFIVFLCKIFFNCFVVSPCFSMNFRNIVSTFTQISDMIDLGHFEHLPFLLRRDRLYQRIIVLVKWFNMSCFILVNSHLIFGNFTFRFEVLLFTIYSNASLLVGNSSNLNIITADAVMQAINDCELG